MPGQCSIMSMSRSSVPWSAGALTKLADAVFARRTELGLRRVEAVSAVNRHGVEDGVAGGITSMMLRAVESRRSEVEADRDEGVNEFMRAKAERLTRSTVNKLDRSLLWRPGDAYKLLTGEIAKPVAVDASDWDFATTDWATYVRRYVETRAVSKSQVESKGFDPGALSNAEMMAAIRQRRAELTQLHDELERRLS